MNSLKSTVKQLSFLCLSLGVVFSFSTQALELKVGDKLPPPLPMVMEHDALEASIIDIQLKMNGAVDSIRAKSCPTCSNATFYTDNNTQFHLGSMPIPAKDISLYNGKSGTLIFDTKSKVLTEVNFFNLEDES